MNQDDGDDLSPTLSDTNGSIAARIVSDFDQFGFRIVLSHSRKAYSEATYRQTTAQDGRPYPPPAGRAPGAYTREPGVYRDEVTYEEDYPR